MKQDYLSKQEVQSRKQRGKKKDKAKGKKILHFMKSSVYGVDKIQKSQREY